MRQRGGAISVSAAIVVATLLQAPGRIAADTKLDLAIAPQRFLARALHLWQPESAFGHLQNQAAGYLFPMGPFFAAFDAAGAPMWIAQRLWIAALLVVAFWGAAQVAERLGIGTPTSRLVGAASYALSPAMIALVGSTSGGQVPAALLPWVLVPLIDGAAGGSARRAAARSALAVVAMGAVNAASTVAALPLVGLWLLTRSPGPRRRRLLGWWVALVALGTLWWTIALVLQSRYGFDFLPFTETASVTSGSMSAFEVLRGSGYWLSLVVTHGPWLPAGWMTATNAGVIGASGLLTAAGLYGLARRDVPERTFLAAGTALGLVIMTAAYGGGAGGPLASVLRPLLDGAASPLRNLHKFEPTIRLPLALGLAHAVAVLPSTRVRAAGSVVGAVAMAAVVVGALPLFSGRLLTEGAFSAVPMHWRQASTWLDGHQGQSLVVPASAFAEYRWGRPLDEPLQPLATGPWAVRNLIPLGSTGATRLLDSYTRAIETGHTADLAASLERAGIRHLVVRNDLDLQRSGAPRPSVVRATLADVSGLRRVARFGPVVRDEPTSDRLDPRPASGAVRSVEIYDVVRAQPPVRAVTGPAAVLTGGPESSVELSALAPRPLVLSGDPLPARAAPVILTDGMRNRDVDFGSVRDNVSYVLTATEPAPDTRRSPVDFTAVPGVGHRTVATMSGAAVLTASSYGPSPPRIPEGQPYAAFDRDPSSGWVPTGFFGGKGQWVQVRFDGPRSIPFVDIRRLSTPGWRTRVTRVVVSTELGTRTAVFRPADDVRRVHLPAGPTRALRVTITGVARVGPTPAGIAEIDIPGIVVHRSLAVAADQRSRLAAGAPLAGVHLTRSSADPFDATRHDEEVRLERRVDIPRPASLELRGTAVARPGDTLSALVASLASGPVHVDPSSSWSNQPAFRGENAMDGDRTTSWVADPNDKLPQLTLVWNGARTVDGIALVPAAGPIQAPERLRISAGSEHHDVTLAGTSATFPAMTTDTVTVTVLGRAPAPPRSRGAQTPIAIGLSELVVHGLGDLRAAALDPEAPLQLPCGAGPDVVIDGITRKTSVRGRVGDLILARPIPFEGCDGPLTIEAGSHAIETTLTGPLAVEHIDLTPPAPPAASATRRTAVKAWAPEHRRVDVGPGALAYLTVNENANDGWHATLDGRRLSQVRLDGWRQGWRLPAGRGGSVELTFAPGHTYRVGLLMGALGVLTVIALSLLGGRAIAPASTSRTFPVVVTGGAATLAVWLVAGPVALAVPIALAVGHERSRSELLARVAGLTYAGAAALVVLQPGRAPGSGAGAYGRPAQLLSGIAIAALLAVVVAPERT